MTCQSLLAHTRHAHHAGCCHTGRTVPVGTLHRHTARPAAQPMAHATRCPQGKWWAAAAAAAAGRQAADSLPAPCSPAFAASAVNEACCAHLAGPYTGPLRVRACMHAGCVESPGPRRRWLGACSGSRAPGRRRRSSTTAAAAVRWATNEGRCSRGLAPDVWRLSCAGCWHWTGPTAALQQLVRLNSATATPAPMHPPRAGICTACRDADALLWALGQVGSRSLSTGDSGGLVPGIDLLNCSLQARPPMLQLDDADRLVMTVLPIRGAWCTLLLIL